MYKILPLLLLGCTNPCYKPFQQWVMVSDYEVSSYRYSPTHGIVIDDPKGEVEMEVLDRTVSNTLACVQGLGELTSEEKRAAACTGDMAAEIRSCLVIKIHQDWYTSQCTGAQLFSCDAPKESCQAKGLEPTAECPCACRAAVQDNSMLITTPNLELVPWRLTELLTGCASLQNVERLSQCGSPGLRDQPL